MDWTEHVQVVAPPPPVAPSNTSNAAYGNASYTGPYVATAQARQQHNSAAIWPLVLGIIAFCISLVGLLPGSTIYFYSTTGIFAIVGGASALARRRKGFGTLLAAPIAAIILGSVAIVCMIIGVVLHANPTSNNYNSSGYSSKEGGSGPGAHLPLGNIFNQWGMPNPPSFASEPNLTRYEQSAENVSMSIIDTYSDGHYSHGNPVAPAGWPTSLSQNSSGQVVFPNGQLAMTIPSDEIVKYFLTSGGASFIVEVYGRSDPNAALYSLSANNFSWICAKDAGSTCPAGGLTSSSAGTGATT